MAGSPQQEWQSVSHQLLFYRDTFQLVSELEFLQVLNLLCSLAPSEGIRYCHYSHMAPTHTRGQYMHSRTSLVRTQGDRQNVFALSGIRINQYHVY